MVMPGKLRSQDQIAFFHHTLLTIDRGIGAAPFENKAESGGSVPVRPCVLACLHVLKQKMNGMRGGLTIAERRIEQADSSTLSVFHADYFAGAHQTLVNILPFPQPRLNRGLGVRSITFETQLPM